MGKQKGQEFYVKELGQLEKWVGYELEMKVLDSLDGQLEYEDKGSDVPHILSQCTL